MVKAASNQSMPTGATALPIEARLEAIREALDNHSRAMLVAEPGAGKTTRVPLALLDAAWCRGQRLLLLEPRRVAARLAAGRMAELLGESVGQTVGVRMRGESRVSEQTRLEVVTQGVLTRMLQEDPLLDGVAGIIFDEFHERSLEADLGLALTLDVQTVRDDLRLLVMSATLDVEALSAALGSTTPLLECPGRQYPVTTHYRPCGSRVDSDLHQASIVEEALAGGQGDVLVILPGVAEIRRLARRLATRLPSSVVTHELHGRLPLAVQRQALVSDAEGRRRVVLATAIAESSVTVEGVRQVIDAGRERLPVYHQRSGLSRLETRRVNRASADQRRGRAGRQAPGVCYRLWSEEQPLAADREPEIRQSDLMPLAFELARWGITEPDAMTWVTPPAVPALAAGREALARLGVLDGEQRLTRLGHACTRWPVHPRMAVMLERAAPGAAAVLACGLVALLEAAYADDERDLAEALQRRFASPREYRGWQRDARRLAGIAGVRLATPDMSALGELLALAWPERIAQRVEVGRFRLASGGQARLPETHPLAHAEVLVAAELGGEQGGGRILRGAELSVADLEALYPETRQWRDHLEWSEARGELVGERRRGLGALVLERGPLHGKPPEAVRGALLEALERRGELPFDTPTEQLRGRVALLRRHCGDDWPDWSDATLLATLESWLGPYLDGIKRLDEIARLPFKQILLERLEWTVRSRLDELAPRHLEVPSGSRIELDYRGETPVLAVKLQEVFGWQQTPRLVAGRVVPRLHLLSPARRPLQVTEDLASFWANGYREVRKEMRGRYPKHPWPEDPLAAEATARTKHRPRR